MRAVLRPSHLRRPRPETTESAAAPGSRRPRHTAGLVVGLLAVFALAAAPVSEPAAETVGDVVSGALTTAVLAGAEEPPAVDHRSDPAAWTVERVVAVPETQTDQIAYRAPEGLEATPPAPEPEPEPEPEPAPEPEPEPEPTSESTGGEAASTGGTVWDRLADCESGDWDADGNPIPGTARWDYGLTYAHEGFEQFQGGLNFHPGTWDGFRDPDMPAHAGHASRAQEIVVGQRVLDAQGWGAWPVCARMLGLR